MNPERHHGADHQELQELADLCRGIEYSHNAEGQKHHKRREHEPKHFRIAYSSRKSAGKTLSHLGFLVCLLDKPAFPQA
jgi:hypothetical protein